MFPRAAVQPDVEEVKERLLYRQLAECARCFEEGVEMVAEGINPALIENVGRQLGMPVGPLAVGDEVSIELGHKIVMAARKELGDAYVAQPSDAVMAKMVELGRLGRKSAKGWYD